MSSSHIINESSSLLIKQNNKISLITLFKLVWQCELSIFFNYFVTLSLFPGVISLMKWNLGSNAWFAIIQIFLFNLTDTFGKFMPQTNILSFNHWNKNIILFLETLRFIFIPLYVLCISPQIFSWYIALIFNIIMGFTNGYLGTISFCLSTKNMRHRYKDKIGSMNVFILTLGLTFGSSFAFVINWFINKY
mmetsp:Transcript_10058/g.12513  ORF Transcript_10058/g.12513 Transcript_10058/m.12513 type:complete len:191 (-) Transcript_10058:7-579(-)